MSERKTKKSEMTMTEIQDEVTKWQKMAIDFRRGEIYIFSIAAFLGFYSLLILVIRLGG
jgi:hypothetical protein